MNKYSLQFYAKKLKVTDTLRRNSIVYKGDNLCNFLFAFLYTEPHLKRDML